MLILYIFW